ncbi:MAG: hypothetical protein ACFB51_10250, partial [Anaerolineae bacterium]
MNRRNRNTNRLITAGVLVLVAAAALFIGQRSGLLNPVVSAVSAPLAPLARLFNTGANAGEPGSTEPGV